MRNKQKWQLRSRPGKAWSTTQISHLIRYEGLRSGPVTMLESLSTFLSPCAFSISTQPNATVSHQRTHILRCLSFTSLSQVHTFYKTWAETYEDDMNKLNFTSENSQFDFVAFRRIQESLSFDRRCWTSGRDAHICSVKRRKERRL